jgi:dTDP-4-amino-4,6-dideoxygalactose transaminase
MYYVLLDSLAERTRVMASMKARGVHTVFHYVPLHSAPAGRIHSRAVGSMAVTDALSERLLRLPLWIGLDDQIDYVVGALAESL